MILDMMMPHNDTSVISWKINRVLNLTYTMLHLTVNMLIYDLYILVVYALLSFYLLMCLPIKTDQLLIVRDEEFPITSFRSTHFPNDFAMTRRSIITGISCLYFIWFKVDPFCFSSYIPSDFFSYFVLSLLLKNVWYTAVLGTHHLISGGGGGGS